jgi:hypothetical protein
MLFRIKHQKREKKDQRSPTSLGGIPNQQNDPGIGTNYQSVKSNGTQDSNNAELWGTTLSLSRCHRRRGCKIWIKLIFNMILIGYICSFALHRLYRMSWTPLKIDTYNLRGAATLNLLS